MKNAIMMVAAMGMFGGAFADKTTVVQPVSAEVANVCTYGDGYNVVAGNPPVDPASDVPGNQTNVDGRTYTDGTRQAIGTYKANDGSTTKTLNQTYIFRCTKGTPWNKAEHTGTQTITMTSASGSTLLVKATTGESMIADSGNSGDIYQGSAVFTIDAGQYSSTAGHYEGKLTIVINYN